MHFLQAINSDLSVLIVCNKTGGTKKGDKKIVYPFTPVVNSFIITTPRDNWPRSPALRVKSSLVRVVTYDILQKYQPNR